MLQAMNCGRTSTARTAWPGLTRHQVQWLAGLCSKAFWTDKVTCLQWIQSWNSCRLWLAKRQCDTMRQTNWTLGPSLATAWWLPIRGAAAEAKAAGREGPDVLNGIAWDPEGKRIFANHSAFHFSTRQDLELVGAWQLYFHRYSSYTCSL